MWSIRSLVETFASLCPTRSLGTRCRIPSWSATCSSASMCGATSSRRSSSSTSNLAISPGASSSITPVVPSRLPLPSNRLKLTQRSVALAAAAGTPLLTVGRTP